MEQSWKTLFLLTLPLTTCCTFGLITTVRAQQVSPDGTLSTTVTSPDNLNFTINDGNRVEGNLFHSFREFSVPNNGSAVFQNPLDVQNIINRVTGGSLSQINGLIQTQGSANLFLLNPAGIFFGQNARLNIGGSFFATTADSLLFDNGFEFSATNPIAPPLLTVNIPVGLRFRDNPGEIRVQGFGNNLSFNSDFTFTRESTPPPGLAVKPGKTLALVGGGVNLEGGNLIADSGRIEVGSVAGSGVVSLTPIDKGWQLGYENVSSLRDIFLSGKASIDTSSNAGAGDIQVQGRNVKLTDGSAIFAFTGSQAGGTVSVNASDTLEVIGTGVSEKGLGLVPSTLYTAVSPNGEGTGGNLILRTRQFIQRGGSQVGSDTYGVGTAGNTIVNASESVTLNGTSDNGVIPTALGTVVQGGASGNGARLTVETKRLRVEDGAQLVTFTFSQGNAASLVLNASESTDVIGSSQDGTWKSAISSSAFADTTGNGGAINLETGKLIVRDRALITASSQGRGNAGDINVKSRSIFLDNQGAITATAELGNGGNINLNVQDYLRMRGKTEISTSAGADGNGGNILINNLPDYRGFVIAVPSENNDIIANASEGRGGNIIINSPRVFGLVVRSRADHERLGVKDLDPRNLFTSDITAFSQQQPELNGTVTIQSPEIDPSRGLVELPETVTDPKQRIAQSPCQQGFGNEFVVTGRGGLPTTPNQTLSSDNVRVDLLQPVASYVHSRSATIKPATNSTATRVPAQGWIFNDKGQVVLTAYDPTNTGSQRSFSTAAACPAR
ncbi:MAG: filamentous hemagglutinin N-terminal domain-containing protein [Tolypothrix carrinoi HA7290-LM1]|jgi:filamentous hemagglutinin family protein|nr:filamentous hemagglutinin N-terminal domain-containing protein [Tolypothrix carrinoi HA7290-LM1]